MLSARNSVCPSLVSVLFTSSVYICSNMFIGNCAVKLFPQDEIEEQFALLLCRPPLLQIIGNHYFP